ncbi:MAG: PHB depolymerase family esterase [Polyangiales bacterium]
MRFALAAFALLAACSSTPSTPTVVDAGSHDVSADPDVSALDAGADAAAPEDLPVVTEDVPAADVPPEVARLVSERPYLLRVSGEYRAGTPAPLLILLHGYGASGLLQESYFRLTREADARGFLYAIPDGTRDMGGMRFWNATSACCDFGRTGVDDVAYLTAIIDDVSARYSVDPRRIYFVGHSNGGFMSHRMACARSNRVAAIISLAGAAPSPSDCSPTERVSVLEVHGTADGTIQYEGGSTPGGAFTSAQVTVAGWATRNGCDAALTDDARTLDLDTSLAGAETRVQRHDNCGAGGAAELWSIDGGAHLPAMGNNWAPAVFDWLLAHPKP